MIWVVVTAVLAVLAAGLGWWWRGKEDKGVTWAWIFYGCLCLLVYFFMASIFLLVVGVHAVAAGLSTLFFGVVGAVVITFIGMQRVHYPAYFMKIDTKNIELTSGTITAIMEMKYESSVGFFTRELGKGKTGLCITRDAKFSEHNPGITVECQWLSTEPGAKVRPQDLEEFSYILNTFSDQYKEKGVVLFDGFSYIVNYHEFMKIMHMFEIIKDRVAKNKSMIIMPIFEKTLKPEEFKMIKTDFVVIQ